jgi:hypothetical protein
MNSGADAYERAKKIVSKCNLSLVDAAMAGQRAVKAIAEGDVDEAHGHLALMVALCTMAAAKVESAEG